MQVRFLPGLPPYHVSKDWTTKGLGTALALDQLIDWLAQEAGEDL
jgi:hypothetical protein